MNVLAMMTGRGIHKDKPRSREGIIEEFLASIARDDAPEAQQRQPEHPKEIVPDMIVNSLFVPEVIVRPFCGLSKLPARNNSLLRVTQLS